jgi:radical SAM protein (TIGR04043 family)/putative N-acetyltransferase (TIGR04045 family)
MIARLVTEIQSRGVRIRDGLLCREGGAGPAEAGFLLIDGAPVSVPVSSPFVASSPYELVKDGRGFSIARDGRSLAEVAVIGRPRFYDFETPNGIAYPKIALLHGSDCLATTLNQRCSNWSSGKRCRFCGIELSLNSGRTIEKKDPSELAEVALAAKELDGIRHVVITTGAGDPAGAEIMELARAASAVARLTGLPIHAQFLPPSDPALMEILRENGVSSVGIHLESPSESVLAAMAPAKAAIGKKGYVRAWKKAVDLFGINQVSSFLIAGLGEEEGSLIGEAAFMADMGVYPFIVPLRPIPGSLLAKALPPEPSYMLSIYREVSRILAARGLSRRRSRAGCVLCGACSALRHFEDEEGRLVCRPASSPEELTAAFALRRDVFVEEQGLFEETDRDEEDLRSIHLVAVKQGSVIGTVRVFPVKGRPGYWMGGRLAIKSSCRANGVGEALVREAVSTVKDKQCNHFSAMIQEENVRFFERLGWRAVSGLMDYHGKPHRLMEADLGSEKGRPGALDRHGEGLTPGGGEIGWA